jgi:NTP pyrophosphatase (non-canonical NTP hydrolase)
MVHQTVKNISPETIETLIILQEECAEVTQAISKVFRFGPDQMMDGCDDTNMQRLEKELGDLLAMVKLVTEQQVGITVEGLSQGAENKLEKLKTWSNIRVK